MIAPTVIAPTVIAPDVDDAVRIAVIRAPRWVDYPRAAAVRRELDELATAPWSHRMPCLLLTGESNNGKTMLVHRFCATRPPREDPHTRRRLHPAVYVLAPAGPDERQLYHAILRAVGAPCALGDPSAALYARVLTVLRGTATRVLVVDELQQLIAGPLLRHRVLLNTLKLLSNELGLSLVGVGTPEAHHAVRVDPQMLSRLTPVELPVWTEGIETRRLLASLEAALPLRHPSRLDTPVLATRILERARGTIGGIVRVVTRAAVLAIETKRERIDAMLIDAVGDPMRETVLRVQRV